MTLHLYFARRFFWTLLATTVLCSLLSGLLDMLEEVRKFDIGDTGFLLILRLTLLNLPAGIYQILPLITILASIYLFLALARSSEMVIARGSGRSALRSLTSPAAVALLFGIAAVTILNPIAAASTKQYENIASRYRGSSAVLSLANNVLWMRQGEAGEQVVIRAAGTSLDGTKLSGVSFLGFSDDGQPTYRIEAASAELQQGEWKLSDAKEWRFDKGDPNPERNAVTHPEMTLKSNLTPDRIRDSFGAPDSIPIWELPHFIDQLEAAGFSARTHRVWLQMQLALPVMLMAMMLVGAAFTVRHTRQGHTGLMVLFALLTGFTLYFVRSFAQILGDRGQIPVEMAAWSPPIAAVLLALGILLHLEDG